MTIGAFNNLLIAPPRSSSVSSVGSGQAVRGGVTVAFEQAENERAFQRGMQSLIKLEDTLKELRLALQVPSYNGFGDSAPMSRDLGLTTTATASTLTSTEAINTMGPFDPNVAFNTSPGLEGGASVVDGSFDLNGTLIAVQASDTLNDVLDRINTSGAGVNATYDAGTESVTFTRQTTGANAITASSDTSGLLSALKLDSAITQLGEEADADKTLQEVAALSGISTGSATINGVSIAIDVTSDTLNDVINRINASGAGVSASLSGDGQQFQLIPSDPNTVVNLNNDTSNLFGALEVRPLTYDADTPSRLRADATKLTRLLRETSNSVNDLFTYAPESREATLTALTELMTNTVTERLKEDEDTSSVFNRFIVSSSLDNDDDEDAEGEEDAGERFRTNYGIHFNFREGADEVMVFGEREVQQLRSGLQRNGRSLYDFFRAEEGDDDEGLLDTWLGQLKTARDRIQSRRGSQGLLLSRTA